MRYLNWDVLLFPGNSRVPSQEFGTKCHVLHSQSSHLSDTSTPYNSNLYHNEIESATHVPVLTSFVSSLEHGSPFRVSIHSWEPPKPSNLLRTFKSPREISAYEARVYIDGNLVAHRVFDDQAIWPEVIESTGDAQTTHPKALRFPMFHSEILDQTHWEPGESYGRIRIVIAEGVYSYGVNDRSRSAFDRLRDLIMFSFQHAPKHVLEYSGIAWPNARLFRAGTRPSQENIVSRIATLPDFQAHAHSPQHKSNRSTGTNPSMGKAALLLNDGRSGYTFPFEDPFVGPPPVSDRREQLRARNSSGENSVKDYNSIRTTRSHALTEMSGVSYAKPNFERAMNEAAIGEIIEALSPEKRNQLLRALSPDQKLLEHKVEACAKSYSLDDSGACEQAPNQPSKAHAFRLLPTSTGDHHAVNLRSDLYSSRYASVPLLTPTTMSAQDQRWFRAHQLSADASLINDWDRANTALHKPDLEQPSTCLGIRSRSTSNLSKRKRHDSLGAELSLEPFKVLPSMSSSPCKEGSATLVRSGSITSATGAGSLAVEQI